MFPGLMSAMDDAAVVSVFERLPDLIENGLHHGNRQLPAFLDDGVQTPPSDELHDEIEQRLVFLDGVDRDDIGMGERRRRAGLPLESLGGPLARKQGGKHDLDGHLAIQGEVVRQVDHRHATATQLREDFIVPDGRIAERVEDGVILPRDRHFRQPLGHALVRKQRIQ